MRKQYSWKAGLTSNYYKKFDANAVGNELETLGDNVTAEQVVEQASKRSSSMHEMFEWDDTKAGYMWRKQQAANILCALHVEYITESKEEKEPVKVRAYVGLKQRHGYHKIETVVEDVDMYTQLLEKAYNELRGVRNKYKDLGEIQEKLSFLDEE